MLVPRRENSDANKTFINANRKTSIFFWFETEQRQLFLTNAESINSIIMSSQLSNEDQFTFDWVISGHETHSYIIIL